MKKANQDIPQARVNITLDLDVGNEKKRLDLPLNILALGNFSGVSNNKIINYSDKEKIAVNKQNFNKVMHTIAPELNFSVPDRISNDAQNLHVSLKVDCIEKFSPKALVEDIPKLKKLLAMRNLLKDLRANVAEDHQLKLILKKLALKTQETK